MEKLLGASWWSFFVLLIVFIKHTCMGSSTCPCNKSFYIQISYPENGEHPPQKLGLSTVSLFGVSYFIIWYHLHSWLASLTLVFAVVFIYAACRAKRRIERACSTVVACSLSMAQLQAYFFLSHAPTLCFFFAISLYCSTRTICSLSSPR